MSAIRQKIASRRNVGKSASAAHDYWRLRPREFSAGTSKTSDDDTLRELPPGYYKSDRAEGNDQIRINNRGMLVNRRKSYKNKYYNFFCLCDRFILKISSCRADGVAELLFTSLLTF